MRPLLPLTFCLLVNLSSSVQAEPQPEVQLMLTQWVSQTCQPEAGSATQVAAPGECITYRLEVVNSGDQVVRNVTVSAPIPVHTRLYRPLRQVTDVTQVTDLIAPIAAAQIEQQLDGQQVLRLVLDELPAGEAYRVSWDYVVQVL